MCASWRLVGVLEYVLFSTSLNLIPTSPETGGLKLGCSLPTLQSLHYITLCYITLRYITLQSLHYQIIASFTKKTSEKCPLSVSDQQQ